MRVLRILAAGLVLVGLVAGCGEDKVKTPEEPSPPPKDEPVPASAPTAPAEQ